MTVRRDLLGVKRENVVRGVTDLLELLRDGETELINLVVVGVGDVAKNTDPHREDNG